MTSSDMAIEADMAYRLYNACLGYTDGVSRSEEHTSELQSH